MLALENAIAIIRHNEAVFGWDFLGETTVGNYYEKSANVGWTTGFCTGMYWLAYEVTGDTLLRDTALVQVDSFLDRASRRILVDHHDLGFLYTPSCVAAWQLVRSTTGWKAAMLAADLLLERYQETGRFIQAWGTLGAPDNYRLIIDCLMNLPLLHWASKETGDPRYREVALLHTQTTFANSIREDDSTHHTFYFDVNTGRPLEGRTAQGYRNDSAWARGQAWAIYGGALAYRHTGDSAYRKVFTRVTQYYLSRLPQDMIPYWDLTFTEGNEPRDSSAGAIAACGMLEMARHVPPEEGTELMETAKAIAGSLARNCATKDSSISNGLLMHGTYAKHSPYNTVEDNGVDECNTWGDYFWMELLVRLSKDWCVYW